MIIDNLFFNLSILASTIPLFFFFQAADGIRDFHVTGVQTCALPIFSWRRCWPSTSIITTGTVHTAAWARPHRVDRPDRLRRCPADGWYDVTVSAGSSANTRRLPEMTAFLAPTRD